MQTRFYQASSSEMFGAAPPPQSEASPFHPRSPYGCAKVMSFWLVNYRESLTWSGPTESLFNHESPSRGETFVTRKITRALALIKAGFQEPLYLGNLAACRDWGWSPTTPTRCEHSPGRRARGLRDRDRRDPLGARVPRARLGPSRLDPDEFVRIDERYYRPAEVDVLLDDASKARAEARVEPTVTFEELVRLMDADVKLLG